MTINSYSGEELDDVKDAGCHLFENGNHNEVGRQVRQAGRQAGMQAGSEECRQ